MEKVDAKVEYNQKFYQVLAGIVSVLFKIARVCVWVGVSMVILVTGIVSVMAANIRIDADKEEVSLFGVTKNYTEIKDEKIEFDDDWEVNLPFLKDKDLKTFFEKDLKWTLWWSVIIMALGIVVLAFVIEFLSQGAKLFGNIAKKDSPFIKENVSLSGNLLKWYIAILIAGYIVTGIAMTAFPKAEIHYPYASLSTLFIMCLGIYLFRYGYNLEAGKKETVKVAETPFVEAPIKETAKAKAAPKAAAKTVKAKAPAKAAVKAKAAPKAKATKTVKKK